MSKSVNLQSAHKLVTSHLKLVAKMLIYREYGLPTNELISEKYQFNATN